MMKQVRVGTFGTKDNTGAIINHYHQVSPSAFIIWAAFTCVNPVYLTALGRIGQWYVMSEPGFEKVWCFRYQEIDCLYRVATPTISQARNPQTQREELSLTSFSLMGNSFPTVVSPFLQLDKDIELNPGHSCYFVTAAVIFTAVVVTNIDGGGCGGDSPENSSRFMSRLSPESLELGLSAHLRRKVPHCGRRENGDGHSSSTGSCVHGILRRSSRCHKRKPEPWKYLHPSGLP